MRGFRDGGSRVRVGGVRGLRDGGSRVRVCGVRGFRVGGTRVRVWGLGTVGRGLRDYGTPLHVHTRVEDVSPVLALPPCRPSLRLDLPWWEKLFGASFRGGKFQLKQLTGGKMDDISKWVWSGGQGVAWAVAGGAGGVGVLPWLGRG